MSSSADVSPDSATAITGGGCDSTGRPVSTIGGGGGGCCEPRAGRVCAVCGGVVGGGLAARAVALGAIGVVTAAGGRCCAGLCVGSSSRFVVTPRGGVAAVFGAGAAGIWLIAGCSLRPGTVVVAL